MNQPTRTGHASGLPEPVPRGALHPMPVAPPQAQPLPVQNPQMQLPQGTPLSQFQQHITFLNQQFAAQMAALGANPMMHNAGPYQLQGQQPPQPQNQPHQPHIHQHPTQVHPSQTSVPQGIPSLQGNPSLTPQQQMHQYMVQQRGPVADQRLMNSGTQRPNSAPPPGVGNTNTVIRETYGPNGERHQSIVSSGTIQINNGVQAQDPGLRRREPSRYGTSRSGTPSGQFLQSNLAPHPGIIPPTSLPSMPPQPLHPLQALQALQARISSMETAMNLGTIPPNSIQEQLRTQLRSAGPNIDQQQYYVLESRRQAIANRASAMQRGIDAQLHAAAEQVAAQRDTRLSEDSAIYLLSSAAGPQALLVSPSGYFATHWPTPSIITAHSMGLPDPPIRNAAHMPVANRRQAHNNAVQHAHPQPNGQQRVDVVEVLRPPQDQQQVAQAPNAARDIVRILIPLGGHLWLLVRLFGFVYFFTHGASWYRTILLSLVAFLLFVAQTGLFQPLLQSMWGPIRRHAEALIPLAGNEQPQGGDEAAAADAHAASTAGRTGEPTPQEAAERLLREREARDGNFMRQGLRRIERAVALFVASLVPGVGERHIAAREAAEAARQREEQEREERARREEEERQQAQSTEESALTSGERSANNPGASAGEPSSNQEPTAQPPLVEV